MPGKLRAFIVVLSPENQHKCLTILARHWIIATLEARQKLCLLPASVTVTSCCGYRRG